MWAAIRAIHRAAHLTIAVSPAAAADLVGAGACDRATVKASRGPRSGGVDGGAWPPGRLAALQLCCLYCTPRVWAAARPLGSWTGQNNPRTIINTDVA